MQNINTPKLLLLVCICFCVSCSRYKAVSPDDVNPERLELARSIADRLLVSQRNGGFFPLSNKEATTAMVVKYDEKQQRKIYNFITGTHGAYEELAFHQLVRNESRPSFDIYRFRGKFGGEDVEVRTTLDPQGKLAGFYLLQWSERVR